MSEKVKLSELQLAVIGELHNIFYHYHLYLGIQSDPIWREFLITKVRERKERYHVTVAGRIASPALANPPGRKPHPEVKFVADLVLGRTGFRNDALTPVSAKIRIPDAKPFRIAWTSFGEGADYKGGRTGVVGGGSYVPRVKHGHRAA